MPNDTDACAAIEALRAQWDVHFNQGLIDELCRLFYTEDALALPPDTPHLAGRDAIRAFLAAARTSGEVSFQLGVIRTEASGDHGWLVGDYLFTQTRDGVTERYRGETHEAYRRLPDGRWQCCVDMWHHVASA